MHCTSVERPGRRLTAMLLACTCVTPSGHPRKRRERARKRALTFQDNDVAVVRRTPEGKAVVVYLEDDGRPVGRTVEAWPDELHGVGWHDGGIKCLVDRLPLQGAPLNPAPESEVGPGSGHHALNVGVRLQW